MERNFRNDLSPEKERRKALEDKIDRLKFELRHLKSQLFRFDNIRHDSKQIEFLTGLTRKSWDCLWQFLEPSEENILMQHTFRYKGGCWQTQ